MPEPAVEFSYEQIKREMRIADNPFLNVFEEYCRQMASNTRVLEWSCKIKRNSYEGARFLHTALSRDLSLGREALDTVYQFLIDRTPSLAAEHPLKQLRSFADRFGMGVAVGYAEEEKGGGRQSEIKVYISSLEHKAIRPLIESIVPASAAPPETTPRIMVAMSVNDRGACRPRIYYVWDGEAVRSEDVRAWLKIWCTAEERRFIEGASSKNISISFKNHERDMVYLSTPLVEVGVNRLIHDRIQPYPFVGRQLDRLRWIGFSKRQDGLSSEELNFYFNSRFP